MAALRQLWHLITRFVGVMASRPLGPRAQESVTRVLGESEAELFWQQQSIDQRHAYEVAARVADSVGEDHPAVVAALLHDVGQLSVRWPRSSVLLGSPCPGAGRPIGTTVRLERGT